LHSRSWDAPPGRGSYIKYCGACHGDDGKGNGPNASTLNEKPTDLTQLAQNNNGTFPTARVTRILDGSEAIAAHGSAQKPVWGHVFGAGEHAAGGNPEQTVARQRMQLILQVSRRHSREIEAHKVLEQTTIEIQTAKAKSQIREPQELSLALNSRKFALVQFRLQTLSACRLRPLGRAERLS
jgi:hypothetical protein